MGLGLYSEQGIEGIHSEFNMQSQHFDHIKKQEVRLRQILVIIILPPARHSQEKLQSLKKGI